MSKQQNLLRCALGAMMAASSFAQPGPGQVRPPAPAGISGEQLVAVPMEKPMEKQAAQAPGQPQLMSTKPDLRLVNMLAPSKLKIWENLNTVKLQIENNAFAGGAPAGNFFVKTYVCQVSGSPCHPFGVVAYNGGSLAVGAQVTLTMNQVFYVPIPPGSYKIKVELDPTNMVNESNETNNVHFSLPRTFHPHCPTKPDFFNHGTGPNPYLATMTRGQTATVSLSYVNQGMPYSGAPVPVKLFLRPIPSGADVPVVWNGSLPGTMATGQQVHFTLQQVTVPSSMPAGTYQWVSQADPANAVAECSETNNWTDPNGPKFKIN